MSTSPAPAAHVKAAIFLASPSVQTLRDLCDAGDFGTGLGTFPRRQILALLKYAYTTAGVWVAFGRNLAHVRQIRRVLRRDTGRDVTSFYNPSYESGPGAHNPRDFREEHEIKGVRIPHFTIQITGLRFRYTFTATPENDRRAPCVDLEALLTDQQRTEVYGSNR